MNEHIFHLNIRHYFRQNLFSYLSVLSFWVNFIDKKNYFVQYEAGRRPESLDFVEARKGQNWTK
jgi:hypothetical protein